ncbi:hypothetical protein WJX72_010187 [[Myrmecia] bisecta]|uniref:Uncharacterized protein n=1 Tax=[Myrmecia] bisecta TaxID=41462 RepID=A0AAW1QSG6_9CHLO
MAAATVLHGKRLLGSSCQQQPSAPRQACAGSLCSRRPSFPQCSSFLSRSPSNRPYRFHAAPDNGSEPVTPKNDAPESLTPSSLSHGEDSDVNFLLRLAALSFTGACLIKYGSLLIDTPFSPNPVLALGMIFGPPGVYSALLLARSQGNS